MHHCTTYWRKWAAKHEYEELKEGIWLEPALDLWRRKTEDEWTDKHRHVARKLVLDGGCVQKRLFDICWSDESEWQAYHKAKGTENHRLYHCPEWYEVRREIPGACRKWEQKAQTSQKEWKWQRRIVAHPLRGHFSGKSGSLRSTKAGACQQRAPRVMLLLTTPCW